MADWKWEETMAAVDECNLDALAEENAELRELVKQQRGTIAGLVEDMERLSKPPTDAAVREAVEYLNDFRHSLLTTVGPEFTARIDTLLSHIRAVQSPRLTGDEFVRWCGNCACGKDEAACDSTATGHDDFDGVKCSGWSPRLTDAQAAALHIAYLRCKEEGSLTDVVEILESTFPGEFGKEG